MSIVATTWVNVIANRISLAQIAAIFFGLGIIGSLASAGATIGAGLVAASGAIAWARGRKVERLTARFGLLALAAYLIVVITDFANGGGFVNIISTAVNYLPVLILVLVALGIRESRLSEDSIAALMQVTVAIAIATSAYNSFWLDVDRPGGFNLNPIPYGLVVLLWSTFLLSRGVERGRSGIPSLAIAFLAIVPIVLTGSKIVWACTVVAYCTVLILHATARRRWVAPTIFVGMLIAFVTLGYSDYASDRFQPLLDEVDQILVSGESTGGSLGPRLAFIESGIQAFLDRPVLGYGLVERIDAAAMYYDGYHDLGTYSHMHNDYVTHLVAYGLFGAVFLALYFALLLYLSLKTRSRSYGYAGYAITAALFLYMFAEVAFNMDPVSGPMALVAGILLSRVGELEAQ